jgi:antitoxin CptB
MAQPDPTPLDHRRRRLIYRACHRGTHETDLLLGGFVTRHVAAMTDRDLDALEEILELPDADLADWLTGRRPLPASADSPLLRAIRDAATRSGAGA